MPTKSKTHLLGAASLAVIGSGLLARRYLLRVHVHGNSMAPTLLDGESVIALLTRRRIRIGTVVVFQNPCADQDPNFLIKRVIEAHRRPDGDPRRWSYAVDGDNMNSSSSANFGLINQSAIVGVALIPRRHDQRGTPTQVPAQ